jgi:hypothetical protein
MSIGMTVRADYQDDAATIAAIKPIRRIPRQQET